MTPPPRLPHASPAVAPPHEIFYPSTDGEPVAETFFHFYALMVTVDILMRYFRGQPVAVLSNQFLYYREGDPKARVAPDVMVIFGITPGPRDNYKVWQEGAVPSIVFEITSASTRRQDEAEKYRLYERLGVQEYWLFDPKGEWLNPALRGYRLVEGNYEPIADGVSRVLALRLGVAGTILHFYRLDTGDRLLSSEEIEQQLAREVQERQQAEALAQQSAADLARLQQRLRDLGIDLEAGGEAGGDG